MIAGVSGELLSSGFLASRAGEEWAAAGAPPAWARALVAWWRRSSGMLGPASAPRAIFDVGARPLLDLLELRVTRVETDPIGHAAVVTHQGEPVAMLLCRTWGTSPASAWRQALGGSAVARLPWALVFTGDTFTLVDATRPWSRRLLTFDLQIAFRQPTALLALWTLASGRSLRGGSNGALAAAVMESDRATTAVCGSLGRGVLEALEVLMSELAAASASNARQPVADRVVFDQSLTIVYRLLFLLFAEARHLVPVWHRIYRDAYSVGALCDRLLADSRSRGVWSALQAISRLAHLGCHAEDLRVTAFNGRLFAPARTPLAERRHVADRAAAAAVLALGTSPSSRGRRRIAFHDLGVEQLGAVYERVLEYEPVREQKAPALALRPTSTERKTTGSFYTPRAMTDFLVRRTLGPLVDGRSADDILMLRVLDPAMGSGAFLVAACRYLADRIEQARVAEGTWNEGEVAESDRAELARAVAERCLYGIDRNPTAVQLTRLSLWLVTLSTDRPLTFLDHHLVTGNSLVGARLADLAFPPARGPSGDARQLTLFDEDARQAWGRRVVPERWRLAVDPSHSAADVRVKERRLERLLASDGPSSRWSRAADLWCGLALGGRRIAPGLYSDLQQHLAGGTTSLPARDLAVIAEEAIAAARGRDAAHWELLFPEVFLDAEGRARDDAGFDAVIGNPPWEVLRADTGDAAKRAGGRDDAEAMLRFIRGTPYYRLHGSGHVNQYQLFVERALAALGPGGRFGLILPSGLQSDVGSSGLRRALFDQSRLDTWIGFDNRRAIFPIHRSMRFVLIAGRRGGRTEALPSSDGGSDAGALAGLPAAPCGGDERRLGRVTIPRRFLERWDPVHLTVPRLAAPEALAIAERALAAPVLVDAAGWGVTFGRELNATDDRQHLVTGDPRAAGSALPVVQGRHLRPFGVDIAATNLFIARARAKLLLGTRWSHPRVCYRDVASASNRVTLIAAVLPPDVVSTHTVFCARSRLSAGDAWCLTALLNSLTANFLVRLQMSTHVTVALMARLPVPRPAVHTPDHGRLVACARSLAAVANVDDDAAAFAELNAVSARLYGLSPAEFRHVVSTFPLLSQDLRQACLDAFA
jgi:hypothetical protein